MSSNKQHCRKCGASLKEGDTCPNRYPHCVERELSNTYSEVERLKVSLATIKDAWFEAREIIGWLWWHHPWLKKAE